MVQRKTKHYTSTDRDTVKFTNLTKAQTVTIQSTDPDLGVELNFKSGEDSGKDDTAAVALNAAKVGTVTIVGGFETVAVNGTGASTVNKLGVSGGTMTKLTVGGTGSTTLNNVTGWSSNAAALSIDASAATGDVTIGTALSSKFTSVKGGQGTNDTLIATNTDNTTISSAFKSEGFETILFTENGSAKTYTINLTNSKDVTTVGLRGSATRATVDTAVFNNIAAGTTLLLQGDGTAASQNIGNITATVKGATSNAPADALTVKINNQGKDTGFSGSAENTIHVGTVTANNVKNITIDAADGDVSVQTLNANKLVSLTLKATEDLIFTTAVGSGATGTLTTIDASQVAGKAEFKLTNNLEKDVTVTTGAGNDKVTLGDQSGGSSATTIAIDLGDGNDTFVVQGSVTSNAILKVNLGAGDDTVEVSGSIATTKDHSIDFGEGTDTLKFAGAATTDISGVTIENLEKVLLTGSGDLTVQAASFSGKSIEISTFGDGRLNLLGTSDGDTIDAHTLTIVGPKGVKITGGAGADDITGSSGDDVIIGGAGADVLNGGAGNDLFTHNAGDGTLNTSNTKLLLKNASAVSISSTDLSALDGTSAVKTIDLAGTGMAVDVVLDWNAGDSIKFMNNNTSPAAVTTVDTTLNDGVDNDSVVFLRGTYSADNGTFVYAAAGNDVMAIYDYGANAAQAYNAVVIVGGGGHINTTASDGAFAYL